MVAMARVRTVFTGVAGSPYYSNLYFIAVTDGPSAQAAVDNVTAFWDTLDSLMNIGLTGVIEAEVPILDSETGEITGAIVTTGGTVDPFNAGEPLPWATQGLVKLSTAGFVNGRRVRGRINIPALPESSSENGAPSAAFLASAQDAIDPLVEATDSTLVVWSRPVEADPEADPPIEGRDGAPFVVTSASVWNKWAQLRSRRD